MIKILATLVAAGALAFGGVSLLNVDAAPAALCHILPSDPRSCI